MANAKEVVQETGFLNAFIGFAVGAPFSVSAILVSYVEPIQIAVAVCVAGLGISLGIGVAAGAIIRAVRGV